MNNINDYTPLEQLEILSKAIGNPNLPHQQLHRLLQCRQAWKKDRGLPATAKRAMEALLKFVPVKTDKEEKRDSSVEEAQARLASGEKLHHATKARLERLVAGDTNAE